MSAEKPTCILVKPAMPNYPYNLCETHGRFIADNLESCPGPVIATPKKCLDCGHQTPHADELVYCEIAGCNCDRTSVSTEAQTPVSEGATFPDVGPLSPAPLLAEATKYAKSAYGEFNNYCYLAARDGFHDGARYALKQIESVTLKPTDNSESATVEDIAAFVERFADVSYPRDVFPPIPEELRARDGVAVDILRRMYPLLASAIRSEFGVEAILASDDVLSALGEPK